MGDEKSQLRISHMLHDLQGKTRIKKEMDTRKGEE